VWTFKSLLLICTNLRCKKTKVRAAFRIVLIKKNINIIWHLTVARLKKYIGLDRFIEAQNTKNRSFHPLRPCIRLNISHLICEIKALWIYKNAPQNAISNVILLNEKKRNYIRPYIVHHRVISCSTSVAKDIRDNFSTVLAHTRNVQHHRLYIYVHFNYCKFFNIIIELWSISCESVYGFFCG